jgi:Domain of unknown function (DUF2431)
VLSDASAGVAKNPPVLFRFLSTWAFASVMAKQNLSKKGLARFHRKKLPKDAVRKNQHLRQQQLQRALDKQHGAAGAGAKKQPAQGGKLKSGALPLAFAAGKRVLLLGEGNLSFAAALVSLFGGHGHGIVATTYDTESEMREVCKHVLFPAPYGTLTVPWPPFAEVRL